MKTRKIIDDHAKWLNSEAGGKMANLSGVNLRGAHLVMANLSGANLGGANLSKANLSGANLGGATLIETDLSGANLIEANLSGADLRGADLSGADLIDANLSGQIPLYADTYRKFVLYVIPDTKHGPRFIAGCRNFSAAEAIDHWGAQSETSQPEYVFAINQYLTTQHGEPKYDK